MLQEASRRHTSLIGLDQVMMMSDQLLYNELAQQATRPRVRQRYADMSKRATMSAMKAAADLNHPMYMQSAAFEQDLAALANEPMTAYEKQTLDDIQLSARIYKTQSHALRVQLMKHQLMAAYASAIKEKKVLVKLGAMHCARGESYLTVYDCGNLLSNLAESDYRSSYHIAIFGKNGIQGSPFKALPARPLDPINGELAFVKPFFEATPSESWVVFNLLPIRKALQTQKISIDNVDLRRTILGYDALVIFPTAHPSHSMK